MYNPNLLEKMKDYNSLPKSPYLSLYIDEMLSIIERVRPELTSDEIREGIKFGILKNMISGNVFINNNYSNQKFKIPMLSLIDQIMNQKPILSTSGVLFKKHNTSENLFSKFVNYLVDTRNEVREIRKRCVKGTHEFKTYENKELNYKVSCNGLYGCAANDRSVFYNSYVCLAITCQGRGCISAALTFLESFLSNNIKFGSLNEVMNFINNIDKDCENSKFNDYEVLSRQISPEEAYLKLIESCGYNNWLPSDDDINIIWDTCCNVNQRTLNRIYYKNNLYKFCDNLRIRTTIIRILKKLKQPFISIIDIPPEIENDLKEFKDYIYEYVYYGHIYIDKLPRIYRLIRDNVVLTDTDSCVPCIDQWVRYVSNIIRGIDLDIRYTREDIDKAIEKYKERRKYTTYDMEYDFITGELVQCIPKKDAMYFIEEESVTFSVVNIISYTLTMLLKDYMKVLTHSYNCENEDKPTKLDMKNEYYFPSVLLTKGGKNYATLQSLKDGFPVPENKQFDIKGMPISKVGIPESTKQALQNILQYDILRNDCIVQTDIFKKFVLLEQKIRTSLKNKETSYYKVSRIKAMNVYKMPLRTQGIKASYAYNHIKSDSEPKIDLEDRNTVLIIKTKINLKNIDDMIEIDPSYYSRMKALLKDDAFKGEIKAIAIPIDLKVPDWIIPFIDYDSIVQDNLKAFPLDELRMSKNDSKTMTHSNMIRYFG